MTAFGFHALQFLAFLGVAVGPVPLVFSVLRLDFGPDHRWAGRRLLLGLTVWTAIHGLVGTFLGASGLFFPIPLLISETALFVLGLGLLTRLQTDGRGADGAGLPAGSAAIVCGVVAILGLFAWRFTGSLILDSDSLAYHLPTMAGWVQSGSFEILPQFETLVGRYPFGWELIASLFILPFGSDLIVALPNLIALVVFGLSIWGLAEITGCPRDHGIVPAVLITTTPIVVKNLNTLHVDLPLAAFFIAALYWALDHGRSRSSGALIGCILATGVCFAVKSSAVVYGVVLVGLWILVHRNASSNAAGTLRTSRTVIALSTGASLFTGGFWYLRNWIQCGSPFGHVTVKIFGIELFPGAIDPQVFFGTTLASNINLCAAHDWGVLAQAAGLRLGWPMALVALGVIAAMLTGGFQNRSWLQLGVVFLLCAAVYVITPFSARNAAIPPGLHPWLGQQLRFALPALAVLGALGARGIALLPPWSTAILAMIALGWAAASNGDLLLPWIIATVACMVIRGLYRWSPLETWTTGRQTHWFIVAGIAVVLVVATSIARDRKESHRERMFGRLENAVAGSTNDGRIGYLLCQRSYPLYSPKLDRKLVYLQRENDSFRQWTERLGGQRLRDESLDPDLDSWLDDIRRKGIVIVAAGPVPDKWRDLAEYQWLEDPVGWFDRIHGDDPLRETVLYRLRSRPISN